jgi:hypothetical protein
VDGLLDPEVMSKFGMVARMAAAATGSANCPVEMEFVSAKRLRGIEAADAPLRENVSRNSGGIVHAGGDSRDRLAAEQAPRPFEHERLCLGGPIQSNNILYGRMPFSVSSRILSLPKNRNVVGVEKWARGCFFF